MQLTGSPSHHMDMDMMSKWLYQNSVSVTGSQKFYDVTSIVVGLRGLHIHWRLCRGTRHTDRSCRAGVKRRRADDLECLHQRPVISRRCIVSQVMTRLCSELDSRKGLGLAK